MDISLATAKIKSDLGARFSSLVVHVFRINKVLDSIPSTKK